MSAAFVLDPRLQGDTHAVLDLPLSRVLLMDDARFPWLILVPRVSGARELLDLDAGDQRLLLAETTRVAQLLRDVHAPCKLNIATLGNVVEQLHVHVIVRKPTDAAWPRPVWGVDGRTVHADAAARTLIDGLRAALGAMSP